MFKDSRMFPLDLQFFAEDSESGAENGNEGSGNDDTSNQNNSGQKEAEKTFTQSQVSSMMAKEKNEGKRSVLKTLGFKSEEEAKKAVDLFNALMKSQKTAEELASEEVSKANGEKDDAVNRALLAESKLACFEAGVSKDSIDDVMAIASTKVTDSKDLNKVLSEMKKDSKYSVFFEGAGSKGGTGNDPGHGKGGFGNGLTAGDYGKRLGAAYASQNSKEQKSNYF